MSVVEDEMEKIFSDGFPYATLFFGCQALL